MSRLFNLFFWGLNNHHNKKVIEPVSGNTRQPSPNEPGMKQHLKFWDAKEKGYITPFDTISGFMTLGYSMIFSVTVGAVIGVFLSITTQTGWFPDPLCRSNVKRIMSLTKEQTSSGAFDEQGVFIPDQFDQLFEKYAKSDPSGNTINLLEFIQMTREQEKLSYHHLRAWVAGMVELMTAYFFVGHRGTFSKQDVRAAYDGTLFYRLKDAHRYTTQDQALKGPYLAKSYGLFSIQGMLARFRPIYYEAQSRTSRLLSHYPLDDWMQYLQQSTLLPRALKGHRPHFGVQGVHSPKVTTPKAEPQDLDELMPQGLTGVITTTTTTTVEAPLSDTQETYLSSCFLSNAMPLNPPSLSGVKGVSLHEDYDDRLVSSGWGVPEARPMSDEDAPLLSKSVSTSSNDSNLQDTPLMVGFLREGLEMSQDWLTEGAGLTGVQTKPAETSERIVESPVLPRDLPEADQVDRSLEEPSESDRLQNNDDEEEIAKQEEEEVKNAPLHDTEEDESVINAANDPPAEPSITPPPEEHYVNKPIPSTPPAHQQRNKKKNTNPPVDTSWGITQ